MFTFFKNLFKRKEVVINGVYEEKVKNPFERNEIQVLDFKEGYVQYKFLVIDNMKASDSKYSMTEWLLHEKYKLKEN